MISEPATSILIAVVGDTGESIILLAAIAPSSAGRLPQQRCRLLAM